MSFRNTFVTDYIYMAGFKNYKDSTEILNQLFNHWADDLISSLDERGYGFYSGRIRTHSGSLEEFQEAANQFLTLAPQTTLVPFRLVVCLESNATITYLIEPGKLEVAYR